ncbi:MAG TPA: Ni/Fe-hydrogenase, b-type cytochrome subunit [Longimicrobiales bacterium]|nr:Ni/Fe-hydrogenase, b-type cytochrome subunit [Longimicrobiales bacterium]
METSTLTRPDSLRAGAPVEYRRVHVWHWPIRAMHWTAAICVLTLVVTGFYIGSPYFLTSGSASDHFMMGRFRFIHFTAAGVLVATGIVRFYWLFVGNKFERWRALFPWSRSDWANLWLLTKKYVFVRPEGGPHYLGHNPLQQIAYTSIYGLALLQVTTGFYLYGLSDTGGFFFAVFGWVGPLLGGAQIVRFLHHVLTWLWLVFIPIHVYLTVRSDVLHRESRITSIVTGESFVRADVDFVDD